MGRIITKASELIMFSEKKVGGIIYPATAQVDTAMLDRVSAQADLFKCTDLDWLLKHDPATINWLSENTTDIPLREQSQAIGLL